MHKVLLADSSVTIQKVVDLVLADRGFELKVVGTGGEALAALSSFKPDIVLADVNLPDINGYELAQRVRSGQETAGTPVILLHGAFSPVDEERMASSGANDSLAKPFEADDLVIKIAALLEAPTEVEEVAGMAGEEEGAEALEAVEVGAEEEAAAVDITDLDVEPVEVEVLKDLSEEAIESAIAEAEEAGGGRMVQEEERPGIAGAEEEVPLKEEMLAAFKEAAEAKIEESLGEIGDVIKSSVEESVGAALSGVGQAVSEAVSAGIGDALSGVGETVRESTGATMGEALEDIGQRVSESVSTALGDSLSGIGQAVADSVSARVGEAIGGEELRSALVERLSEDVKGTVEKILWESAPELTENLMKETLKETMGSLKQEMLNVIWETIPELAESLIKSEIEKIRAKS